MPEPPASKHPGAMTLFEARQTIATLRQQLAGHGKRPSGAPSGGKEPIPRIPPPDPHPLGLPGRTSPVNPKNVSSEPSVDLSNMAPAYFQDFISHCGDKELKKMLAAETSKLGKHQDSSVI